MNGSFGVNVAGGFDGIVLKPTASDGLKRMIQSAVCTTARPVDEMSIDVTLSDLAAGRVATTTVAAQLLDLLDSSLGVDSVHHWRAVAKSAIDIFVDLISYSSRDVVAASSRAASWRANKSFHGLERASSGGVGLPFQLPSLNRIHSFESIDGDTSARGAADHHDDSHLSMVLPDIQVTSDDVAVQTPPMAATPVAHANRATIGDEEVDGTFTINQHLILMPIGRGSQGEVFLAMDTTRNKLRAIKAIRRPKGVRLTDGKSFDPCSEGLRGGALAAARHQRRVLLEKEVAIMKRCRHRHLVALYEVIDDPELDVMYLVMQYVENGPLARIATDGTVQKTIPPNKLADYALQIVSGLKYLHSKGVIHRDIKPDNILLGAHDDVYLADFGTSELFDCNSANIRVRGTRGTLAFMAPELFAVNSGEERSHGGPGVDVWALGVTLYTLLYGKLPWAATTSVNLCEEIMSASVVMPPTKDSPILFDSSSDTPSRHTKTCLPSPLAATDPLPEFFDVSLCSPESALNTPRCPNIGSPAIAASSINGSNFLRRRLGRRTLDEMWATLLAGMLHRDPEQRFKLDEITQHLNAIKSSSFDALDSMMMASFAELAVEPISVVRRVSVAPTA